MIFAQLLLIGLAIVLALWVRTSGLAVGGLVVVGAGAILARSVTSTQKGTGRFALSLAMVGTLLIPASFMVSKGKPFTSDAYFAAEAWLVATILFLAGHRKFPPTLNLWWRVLEMTWLFLGGLALMVTGYLENRPGLFYLALSLQLAWLIFCKHFFCVKPVGIQLLNTLILLTIGLPVADLLSRPAYLLDSTPDPAKKYYSYETARKDPSAYRRWWRQYLRQWDVMAGGVFMPDPARVLPLRLKPNGVGYLFKSRIQINSRGFRGKEFAAEKGNVYRIIALGESTTFGCTLNPGDRPWPEILEEIIRDRLHPARPVEVINAGVPAYTLTQNLSRLGGEIFPLKPDLIISYHGFNGLHLLRDAMPRADGPPPPAYEERPVKILAHVEYNLRLRSYQRRLPVVPGPNRPARLEPLETPYAKAYEELIRAAQAEGIRLAIANFSMAVTPQSPTDVLEFYRAGFPSVHWQTRANVVHSEILRQLSSEHPEVCFIDTHPQLDGDHEKFIDLVHFAQPGRQQIAENVFAGIRRVLEQEFGRSVSTPAAPGLQSR